MQYYFRMEKEEIRELIEQFDQFVSESLLQKRGESGTTTPKMDQVQKYQQGMEKRLKLKAPSPEQKFHKKFSNIKDMRGFISVQGFMKDVKTPASALKKKQHADLKEHQNDIRQQYEQARGGYYLEKVEEHLRQHNFHRSSPFPTEQDTPFQTTQFGHWVENTLTKITHKPATLFRSVLQPPSQSPSPPKREHERKKTNLKEKCDKEYEKFKKVSSMLTARLRRLLKNNCGPKHSKVDVLQGTKGDAVPGTKADLLEGKRPVSSIGGRKTMTHRTSLGVGRETGRVKTAGIRKEGWRDNLSRKINFILQTES